MGILDGLIGAMLVSLIGSAILFGVLTAQAHSYFTRFPNDPRWVKYMVAILWAVDCAHQICTCMAVYDYTISHFAQPAHLIHNLHSLGATVTLEPINALIVQLYFSRRLYLLNRKWWPVVVVTVALGVLAFGTGGACGIIIHFLPLLEDFKKYTWLVTLWLITCCVCDVIIAAAIAWQLWHSRSGFEKTDKLLTKLTLWTVNTGLLPAVVALFDAVTFVIMNNSLVHLAANILLAKLYTNTALAFLNRRTSERDFTYDRNGSIVTPHQIHLSTLPSATISKTNSGGLSQSTKLRKLHGTGWHSGPMSNDANEGDVKIPVSVEVSRKIFVEDDQSPELSYRGIYPPGSDDKELPIENGVHRKIAVNVSNYTNPSYDSMTPRPKTAESWKTTDKSQTTIVGSNGSPVSQRSPPPPPFSQRLTTSADQFSSQNSLRKGQAQAGFGSHRIPNPVPISSSTTSASIGNGSPAPGTHQHHSALPDYRETEGTANKVWYPSEAVEMSVMGSNGDRDAGQEGFKTSASGQGEGRTRTIEVEKSQRQVKKLGISGDVASQWY